jgi:hypothetical protein
MVRGIETNYPLMNGPRPIDKRINKGMLSEGIAERKIPHTEKPPEAWP